MELKGKVAVITGGASGIGRALCIQLAQEGVRAIGVVDMGDATSQVCAEANTQFGREVLIPFRGDVTDSTFRESVFCDLEKRFGMVGLCVPAAGITRDRLAVKIEANNGKSTAKIYDEADFRRVIDVDLIAPIYWALRMVASVAVARARGNKPRWEPEESVQGAIVLIGSISSAGNRGQISYATAKAGL